MGILQNHNDKWKTMQIGIYRISCPPALRFMTVVTCGAVEREGMEFGRHIKGASTLVILFLLQYKTEANPTKCQIVLILGDRYLNIYYIILCTFTFATGETKMAAHTQLYSWEVWEAE